MQCMRAVTSDMASVIIDFAPKPVVLWHREQQQSARFQGPEHLIQCYLVLIDVFEHVKSPDGVKFINKGDVPCIHLHEFDNWHSIGREGKAFGIDLAGDKMHFWELA